MSHNYGKTITLENVTVMYASLDGPDKWAPDTHNVTVSMTEDQYNTLTDGYSRINGIKNPHTVRDNPDHEYNGLISLKAKSKSALKKGLARFPRAVADNIDPNTRIMSSDVVTLKLTPVTWGSGPAAGTTSFMLDGIRLEQIGPRTFLSGGDWGWDQDSLNQLDQTAAVTNDDAPADEDAAPVPAADDSDIPF